MSPLLPRVPRSSSDHSDLFRRSHHRRASSPISNSHLNISSITDKLRPLTPNLSEGMDRFSPDPLGSHTPCSPRSPRCSLSPFSPFSPICPCSQDIPLSPLLCPTPTKTAACGYGEGCPWMMELLRGGLSWMSSVAELCQGAVLHAGELLAAEGGSLSLVKKDCSGRNNLEEVTDPTALGNFSEGLCSHAHMELLKGIMGCVLASGSPMNLRDVSEVMLQPRAYDL